MDLTRVSLRTGNEAKIKYKITLINNEHNKQKISKNLRHKNNRKSLEKITQPLIPLIPNKTHKKEIGHKYKNA